MQRIIVQYNALQCNTKYSSKVNYNTLLTLKWITFSTFSTLSTDIDIREPKNLNIDLIKTFAPILLKANEKE